MQIQTPTLSNAIKLWDDMIALPSLTSDIQLLTHILHNPHFKPGVDIKSFQWWLDKGMYRIGHYFSASGTISLKQCIDKLDLPEKFRYYQISHFLHKIWKNKPTPPESTQYKRWCGQAVEQNGGISIIYVSRRTHIQTSIYSSVGK